MKENSYISHDGKSIFYRSWGTETQKKNAVVLLHRGHEHSARVSHLVGELDLEDSSYFAWDARGNGRTEGKRGYAPNFSYYVKDLDIFIKNISEQYNIPVENITIIAQSVGAVIASAWIHDYAPKIKAAVLASPAFNVNLIVPGAKKILSLWQKIYGNFTVKSYVKGTDLTHDKPRSISYHKDPLVSLEISSNILLELYEVAERVVSDAGAINTPILLLSSGDDKVVFQKEQDIFFDNLSSKIKKKFVLEGFYHDTLGEKDRHIAINHIKNFLNNLDEESNNIDLSTSDSIGYTYEEFVKLSEKLPKFSFLNLNYSLVKFGIKKIGRYLSQGIYIAETTGHDSGSTLDYVYKNEAQGKYLFGKLVDKIYLNSIGWRGIRVRKKNLEKVIGNYIEILQTNNKKVNILDIAAGHGRYVLDAIIPYKKEVDSILLRDYLDINVIAGNKLISDKKLTNIANFVKADAFDTKNIANIKPKPTLVIVSGLYELFSDNTLLEQSLDGLEQALDQGAYLIYTNQPWHPQIELIARTLTSHRNNQDWVMRRRTQAEMDYLVESRGFKKIDQFIDQWGIFTVSVAKKI